MKKLHGMMTVLITPFTSNDEFNEKGFRENIDWLISEGVHGLIATGSTSEFASLSDQELKQVIRVTVEQASGRVPVMAGTAANSTKATIERTKYAQSVGADAALIVPPFYGLPSQKELFEHYKSVSQNVDIQIMLYNNPWFSGVDMSPETIAGLAEFPTIQYVKESSADMRRVHEIQHLGGDNIEVWCGWDDLALECFLMGCSGWVCPTSNFLPKFCAELFERAEERNYESAREMYFRLLPFLQYLESGQLVAKAKEALNLIGKAGGVPRRPFLPLTSEQKAELKTMLESIGAI
ncbi:MAG: 4-hydroxy-tetrahydrodipicolinate synthase [Desulfohalobiaceae bacterium]|nr:4-hydroxy-tetrahydrodipicolinate synthase [Desulfohalobiaceae bacterium]